jgi:hypothetical protein
VTTHTPIRPDSDARVDVLVREGLKLIVGRDEDGAESVELYDLNRDPGETRNLAPARPARVKQLRAELEAARAEHEALRAKLGAEPVEGVLSEEEMRALHELGYVH